MVHEGNTSYRARDLRAGAVVRTGSVTRVARCALTLSEEPWAYASAQAAAIKAHWDAARRANPGYFDGTVLVMAACAGGAPTDVGGTFTAQFHRTGFKSFLHWRENGYPEAGAADAFGSAILRSREGHVLLGRQSAGNINSGLAYPPGGFIDMRDVAADGTIDIAASIARELKEETLLDPASLTAMAGFLIVRTGSQVAIGREFRSDLPAEALRAQILAGLAADPDPELADIVIVRNTDSLVGLAVPDFATLALEALFAGVP